MKNKKTFLVLFSLLFLSVGFFCVADTVSLPNPLCPSGGGSLGCVDSFPSLINVISNFVFSIIGGLAVIMFIWSGILFVTSAGNEGKLGNAKKALWWAVIGSAIAIAGRGLIAVISAVVGSPPS